MLGVALEGDSANVQVLQVRDGVLAGPPVVLPRRGRRRGRGRRCWCSSRYEFYSLALAIPPLVIVAQDGGAAEALEALLTERRGSARRGARGARAATSASWPSSPRATRASPSTRTAAATSRRAGGGARRSPTCRAARPARAPARIESYDISNLGETFAVASMVVFEGGAPAKSHYRTFTMRDDGRPDDFARIRRGDARAASAAWPGRARTTRRSRRARASW